MPLTVHFLNVGEGDCTIIEFPSGRIGMVDVNNLKVLDESTRAEFAQEYRESLDYLVAKSSGTYDLSELENRFIKRASEELTDPVDYFDSNISNYEQSVFRMVVTHPHMDHMSGLHRLLYQEDDKSIINFWHTGLDNFDLDSATDESWSKSRYSKEDWEAYKLLRGGSLQKSLEQRKGRTGSYWSEDGVEIWSPTQELVDLAVEKNDQNILSMVLKISYEGKSILLGGDADADNTWSKIYPYINMTGIDVLKASHHGRKSGYHQSSVKEMAPWLTITSVGAKAHDATDSYRRYSDYTVSLRKAGDIKITIGDDGILRYPSELKNHWKDKKN